jgi:hypothetical protein
MGLLASPWVWLSAVVLLVGTFGTGFMKGAEWEQGKAAKIVVETLIKRIETIKYVVKKDNEIVVKHEQEKARLRDEMDGLRREYDKLRGELDKRDGVCDLPPAILGVLNRARGAGGPTPNPGKPDATVRPIAPPAGWATGGTGTPDAR